MVEVFPHFAPQLSTAPLVLKPSIQLRIHLPGHANNQHNTLLIHICTVWMQYVSMKILPILAIHREAPQGQPFPNCWRKPSTSPWVKHWWFFRVWNYWMAKWLQRAIWINLKITAESCWVILHKFAFTYKRTLGIFCLALATFFVPYFDESNNKFITSFLLPIVQEP